MLTKNYFMKKILISLSLLSFVLIGTVSCSSDDNSNKKEKDNQKPLVLTTDALQVKINEEVTFSVTVGTDRIEGTQIYINGKVGANPFKFDQPGVYNVVAKKEGYKDSNELKITVVKGAEETEGIVGTWIPMHVNVTIPMSEPISMPYPKQKDCNDDTLTFDLGNSVNFKFHDESCKVTTTGTSWSLNEKTNMLSFTLFDEKMEVKVVTNTKDKLVIKAKGNQFAPLIPILVPDLAASLPPALLGLIEVELQFNKQ